MARVSGKVVDVRDGRVLVSCSEVTGACGACARGHGCSWRRLGTRHLDVSVPPLLGDLEAGETVELEVADGRLLAAVAALYGPPLIGLLAGPLLLRLLGADAGLASLLAAAAGLGAGLLAARRLTRRGAAIGLTRA